MRTEPAIDFLKRKAEYQYHLADCAKMDGNLDLYRHHTRWALAYDKAWLALEQVRLDDAAD